MDKLTELLAKRKWEKRCLRTNIAAPEDIRQSGKVRVALVSSNCVKKEKEPKLYEAIREAAPEWWEDVRITVNKDVVAQRHRDGNAGYSWILWLGDFTGGELNFDDGMRIEKKGVWHKIDGRVHHWNDPHVGTKCSIILYRSEREPKSRILHAKRKTPLTLITPTRHPTSPKACCPGDRTDRRRS